MASWKKEIFTFGIIANVQYYILTIIAMFFYAGGHFNNPSAPGYTFWSNYYSDLGLIVAYSGKINIISQTILGIAGMIWIILTIIFSYKIIPLFERTKRGSQFCKLGSVLMICSAITFVGTIFSPLDLNEALHGLLAGIAYLVLMMSVLSYCLAIYYEKEFSNKYIVALGVMGFFLIGYSILNAFGPAIDVAPEWLEIYVTAQKIITSINLIALTLFSYGVWKFAPGRIE